MHIEPTFQRRQRQISWVWDHVTRCLAHGNFSQLHTSDEIDVSPLALVNAYAHAHMNGDHPENEERPPNSLVTNVLHRHKQTKKENWKRNNPNECHLFVTHSFGSSHSAFAQKRLIIWLFWNGSRLLTCDGVKNKYVWVEPWITLCNGFTCGCPSNRKWADNRFVHGLLAT